jgi:hypothetical protein
MHTKFWSGILKGRDDLREVDVGGRIILEWILDEYCVAMSTGFVWLRIGASESLLRTRERTFRFHKRPDTS